MNLLIGVKRSLSRLNDPRALEAKEGFERVRYEVLQRDRLTCRFCGARTVASKDRPSGYFEVHHLDDDHHNNRLDNLVTVCPFCHMAFTAGLRGDDLALRRGATATESAEVLWLPWISQNQINLLAHVVFQIQALSDTEILRYGLDEFAQAAQSLEDEILEQGKLHLMILFDKDPQGDPLQCIQLYEALQRLPSKDYENRHKLYGLRLWPKRDAFQEQILYWKEHVWKNIPPSSWINLLKGIEKRFNE